MNPDDLNWVISVDDHALEAPDLWQSRVPSRLRDVAPRLVPQGEGDAWVFEDRSFPFSAIVASVGNDKEDFSAEQTTYAAIRPGCYDPKARVEDMDAGGILASLCYPSFPWFTGLAFSEMKDPELALACVRALNDWLIEEWCGSAPGRFIPGVSLPIWDPAACVTEIERGAAMGARAIFFPDNPGRMGFPSLHDPDRAWDPVFSIAQESGMPLCMHIGSSSWKMPKTSEDCPLILSVALAPIDCQYTVADWLFSGNLERFPGLKLCLAEGGIGWIPYLLQRCDYTVDRHGPWAARGDVHMDLGAGELSARPGGAGRTFDVLPSQLFRDHVAVSFIEDSAGMANLDAIGVGNVVVEVDYPHPDSNWPNTVPSLRKQLAGRSDEDVYAVFQGNAITMFDFTSAAVPGS
jgi:predicted TIM-barrel fold metal-dependent hydrolase